MFVKHGPWLIKTNPKPETKPTQTMRYYRDLTHVFAETQLKSQTSQEQPPAEIKNTKNTDILNMKCPDVSFSRDVTKHDNSIWEIIITHDNLWRLYLKAQSELI